MFFERNKILDRYKPVRIHYHSHTIVYLTMWTSSASWLDTDPTSGTFHCEPTKKSKNFQLKTISVKILSNQERSPIPKTDV